MPADSVPIVDRVGRQRRETPAQVFGVVVLVVVVVAVCFVLLAYLFLGCSEAGTSPRGDFCLSILLAQPWGYVILAVPPAAMVGAQVDRRMPFQWHEAIATLRKAKILPDYLGADNLALYADAKAAELAKFNNALSPREHEWYL